MVRIRLKQDFGLSTGLKIIFYFLFSQIYSLIAAHSGALEQPSVAQKIISLPKSVISDL